MIPSASDEHTLTGDIRVHERVRSTHLGPDRTLIVFRPPRYDAEPRRRYPVLYAHDGQNLFDRATSVGEEWGLDETAHALITAGAIEPLIIVGIYNAGERRGDEYAPTHDERIGAGGQADRYGRMLVEEIKPLIDREYRTLSDREATGMMGSSLGGLLTLHLGITHPGVFGRLAVLSPSVWWHERRILDAVRALPGKVASRIWLDAGTKEGDEVIADTRALRDALVARGWVAGDDLAYSEIEGGEHDEKSWAARVEPVLRYLYPARS
jgi:predicted alpha/beta superfamily hydrolase